jgi:hypothetical protein
MALPITPSGTIQSPDRAAECCDKRSLVDTLSFNGMLVLYLPVDMNDSAFSARSLWLSHLPQRQT